ncbi:hypothetical protein [Pseudomonas sp. FEN]|nr:hypothetical protein [Pseudomonas sp. FEN]
MCLAAGRASAWPGHHEASLTLASTADKVYFFSSIFIRKPHGLPTVSA